jgi:hypothetical protein
MMYLSVMNVETKRATFSIPSIIAVIAALGSFMTGAIWGLMLAFVAILFGVIGVLLSLSPTVRGGFISIVGVGAGLIGIIAAAFKALGWFFGAGA